jgi:transcriptional regulator with XRE-family HTH domain
LVQTVAKDKDTTGFGERLRALRVAAGMTQQELADKAEMHSQSVNRLERGGRSPSWEIVLRLAQALGVSTDDFKPEAE